jgi:hypothetical protein
MDIRFTIYNENGESTLPLDSNHGITLHKFFAHRPLYSLRSLQDTLILDIYLSALMPYYSLLQCTAQNIGGVRPGFFGDLKDREQIPHLGVLSSVFWQRIIFAPSGATRRTLACHGKWLQVTGGKNKV